MAFGRQLSARLGAAALLAGAAGLVVSSPAAADSEVTGTYAGNNPETFRHVVLAEHGSVPTNVKLIEVGSGEDASVLQTYCIELEQGIGDKGTKYQESDWDEYFDDQATASKINWILRNSYPKLSIEQLRDEVADVAAFADDDLAKLNPRTAAAGTQAAIWHFSDGAELVENKNPEIIWDLYSYLTGDANVGASNEPEVKLDIGTKGDGELTAKPGEPFGPFTVHTTSSNPVELSVESETDGVRLVQKTDDGYKKVKKVSDGDTFYVEVPADAKKGKATIKAETMATVEVGRVFRGLENPDDTQTLILASTGEARVTFQGEFTWKQQSTSPSPTPSESGGQNEAPVPTPVHTSAPVTG